MRVPNQESGLAPIQQLHLDVFHEIRTDKDARSKYSFNLRLEYKEEISEVAPAVEALVNQHRRLPARWTKDFTAHWAHRIPADVIGACNFASQVLYRVEHAFSTLRS